MSNSIAQIYGFFANLQIKRIFLGNSIDSCDKFSNFELLNKQLAAMTGRVKWFDDKRGYGFITTDEGADIYVHYTAIMTDGYRTLKHNWRVDFEVVAADDGRPEARSVVVLPKPIVSKDAKRRKR